MLCLDCREKLEEALRPFSYAEYGTYQLFAEHLELPNRELIHNSELISVLVESDLRSPNKKGPLSQEDKLKAVEILRGKEMANSLRSEWEEAS